MQKFIFLTLVSVAAILDVSSAAAAATTTASPQEAAILKVAKDQIAQLEQVVDSMARQLMQQQTFVEERVRSEGMSGIKAVHHIHEGTAAEFGDSHIGNSAMNLADRAYTTRKLGVSDFVAVLNGVEFHSVYNGRYALRKPTSNSDKLDELEDIPMPDLPPAVKNKRTIQEQIDEMRLWFKAFKDQDYSQRDYRKYFKPNLCYLEGAWYLNHNYVNEPDTNDKHFRDPERWFQHMEETMFQAYDGARSQRENYEYLPTMLYNMSTNRIPQFAGFRSRLACHPISFDVPTSIFKPLDDLAARMRYRRTWGKVPENNQGRFRINEFGTERNYRYSILDKIMAEIPGKDNYGANTPDDAFGLLAYDISKSTDTVLNAANYHRWYKLKQKGAMGLQVNHRGYHDENLWVSLTSQKDIMPLSIHRKISGKDYWETRRISYAVPIEIVYTSPLASWNPYNIESHGTNNTAVRQGGRNGGKDKAHAYNGNSEDLMIRTPKEFYGNTSYMHNQARGVLDRQGNVRLAVGVGSRLLSYPIDDLGRIRFRYPIFPVHSEGHTVSMELEALKDAVMKMPTYAYLYENQPMVNGAATGAANADVDFLVKDTYRNPPGLHGHDFTLTAGEYQSLMNGTEIKVTTSYNLGHNHELTIYYNKSNQRYLIRTCDGQANCWDAHSHVLDKVPT